MAGGNKSDRMEMALIALLNCPDLRSAAREANIGETTLFRWLQDERFQKRYAEAKQAALSQAIAQLQVATGAAVQTLRRVAGDESCPASARVSAAKALLELSFKSKESEELEQRIATLEQDLGESGKRV